MTSSFELLWGTTSLSEEEQSLMKEFLSSSERVRANFLSPSQSSRYVAGRYFARELGAQLLQTEWTSVVPTAHCEKCGMDHGAIHVQGSDLKISLSYSGDRLVAAGTFGQHIGIDIEHGRLADQREIAARSGLLEVSLAQWCEYEAVVKAAGVGITHSFDEVTVINSDGSYVAQLAGLEGRYEMIPATQQEDVVLAVALRL